MIRSLRSVALVALALGCSAAEDPPRLRVKVAADASEIRAVLTDLGYEVRLTEAAAVVADLHFLVSETATARYRPADWLLPRAHAHPGHHHGGAIAGELAGRFVLRWLPEASRLGEATLLSGRYVGASYAFVPAEENDGVEPEDPLHGRAALLGGRVLSDERELVFVVLFDPPDQRMDHVPFDAVIDDDSAVLGLRLKLEADGGVSLFDGIDFFALAPGAGEPLVIASDHPDPEVRVAHQRLRSAFFHHRFHEVRALRGR
ncbi:MAG: hypothetical protein DIU72_008770 [Pseudomonadota bacterium]|nr:MAG: hypothetical protein DIU72_09655 [Pseudomonadota bacterium]